MKDLLLDDFKGLDIKTINQIKGGTVIETNTACTDGDEEGCDNDTTTPGQGKPPPID